MVSNVKSKTKEKGNKVLVVLGPTASGKTSLSVKLAKRFNGEIISADSRQVYEGLDLGTGKITKREMQGIPHYLIDIASPRSVFSAVSYQRKAKQAIKKVLALGKLPIVVGGTGFYIDALLYDYKLPNVKPDPKLRKQLIKHSAQELFSLLQKKDPQRASTIDRHNKHRLVRALEIVIKQGSPVPLPGQVLHKKSQYDVLKIGLRLPNEVLKESIHKRLLVRMRKGLIREVKNLKLSANRLESLGLEYRWVSRYLRSVISKQEMLENLKRDIRHYAKRQMTWFKRDPEIQWIKPKKKEILALIKKFLKTTKAS